MRRGPCSMTLLLWIVLRMLWSSASRPKSISECRIGEPAMYGLYLFTIAIRYLTTWEISTPPSARSIAAPSEMPKAALRYTGALRNTTKRSLVQWAGESVSYAVTTISFSPIRRGMRLEKDIRFGSSPGPGRRATCAPEGCEEATPFTVN